VHAAAESALPPDVAAQLPADVAPAPWSTRLDAVVWWHRATDAAVGKLPVQLRGRRRLPLTVAGFVRYLDTPVGPYHEVLASPVVLLTPVPAGSVPFIAVDSLDSIAGGRENWALPKTLAEFAWTEHRVAATGEGWSVTARVARIGPALPFAAPALNRQVGPDGRELTMGIRGLGRARLTRVDVDVEGPDLPSWLNGGRHPAVAVSGARVRFGVARPN
jgi:Acetoacetate decarboxylase (ADC)